VPSFKSSFVVAVAVLGFAGVAVASPLRSGAKLTVTPPAYYVGTNRADTLVGTNGNNVLLGRGGNDTLYGRGGNDVLEGGIGNDRLYGGPGRDTLLGGPGNDRLYARDGQRDVVNGGPGFDIAWVDKLDVVRNVERVYRR
jgi:RTX calcium-binding nonapeptide repeat (4 copies)